MKRRVAVACVLAGLIGAGCRGASGAASQGAEGAIVKDWLVSVESEGGITGAGEGSVEILSNGEVTRTTPAGTECRASASPEALRALQQALDAAINSAWDDRYHQRGADFFTYTMLLDLQGDRRTVTWNDGADIPESLSRVWSAVRTIRNAVECHPTR